MKKIGKALILSTGILIGGTVLPFASISLDRVEASSTYKVDPIIYQATSNVNLRTGPGTNYKLILTIPKSKIVTVTQKKGNWYKVSYSDFIKGKKVTGIGWTSVGFLKEYYKYSKTSGIYYFTRKTTSLYPTPNTIKKAVYSLQSDVGLYSTQMVVNSVGQTWYTVNFNGKNFYVNSSDVSKCSVNTFAKTYYLANKDTYVYSSYGSIYKKLIIIPKGTIAPSVQSIGNWFAVTYNGKSGYFYKNDFTKIPSETPVTDANDFVTVVDGIIRQYPDDQSNILSSVPKGSTLTPTYKTSNDWYKVTYGGKLGYIHSSDLQEVKNTIPQEIPPTEVSLVNKTYLVTANLNLRQDGDSSSLILTSIPKGTIVTPSAQNSDNWYKVTYGGNTGYVYGNYLQQVVTGAPAGTRDSYQFIDLRTQSPVTASEIDNYIANYEKLTGKQSVLHGKGQVFINVGTTYGVNALYLAAHSIHESAFGTSNLAVGKNNLFGFGAYDDLSFIAAYRFSSVDACIDYIAREIKSTYLNPNNWKYKGAYLGFSTKTMTNVRIDGNSEGMNFYYASDPNWGKAIAQHMQNILPYDKAYYAKSSVNASIPSRPGIPSGSDLFPNNITAIANKDITLDSQKGASDSVLTINKGTSFILSEKTNDYWVRVKVGDNDYWTNNLHLDHYSDYLSVQNLGRVTVSQLNIRSGPSADLPKIGTLNLNDYVQLMLQDDGTVTMDDSKTWYEIQLPNGTTGWVCGGTKNSPYLSREFN
ncbi:MAG: SH3 domain-containing protein [Bacillota bacterium]|nr:SH3 domain-containing protein [Bacillota bacterium]